MSKKKPIRDRLNLWPSPQTGAQCVRCCDLRATSKKNLLRSELRNRRATIKKAVAFLVTLDPTAEKTARINITGRERDIQMIDRLANEAGLSRSAFMVQASLSALHTKREVRKSR